MMKRIGIIGSGSIVPFHIEAIQKLGSTVESIASRPSSKTTQLLADKFNIKNIYRSGLDLVKNSDNLDGLLICTPPEVVPEILSYATALGVPVLIEKPGMIEQNDLNSYSQSKIFVAYNRRFYKTVNLFKENLKGRVGFFNFEIVEDKACITDKELLLSTLKNNSIHYFDLMNFLNGKYLIGSVDSLLGKFAYKIEILSCNGQLIGFFFLKFGTPTNSGLSFENSEISLKLQPLETLRRSNFLQVIEPDMKRRIRSYLPMWLPRNEHEAVLEDSNLKPGFELQMKEFLAKADTSTRIRLNLAGLDDAAFAIAIAQEIYHKIEASDV